MAESSVKYFESLEIEGQVCPPEDAVQPDGKKEYYRVLKSNPPTSDCFISHRIKFPEREFDDECEARSVSLSDSLDGLINGYFRMQANKKKARNIGAIVLTPNDGVIKQTGFKTHYSWWRSTDFELASVTVKTIEV